MRPLPDGHGLGARSYRIVAGDVERRCEGSFPDVHALEEIRVVLGRCVGHFQVLDQESYVGPVLAAKGDELHGQHVLRWRDVNGEPRFRWSPSGSLRPWRDPGAGRVVEPVRGEAVLDSHGQGFFGDRTMTGQGVDVRRDAIPSALV